MFGDIIGDAVDKDRLANGNRDCTSYHLTFEQHQCGETSYPPSWEKKAIMARNIGVSLDVFTAEWELAICNRRIQFAVILNQHIIGKSTMPLQTSIQPVQRYREAAPRCRCRLQSRPCKLPNEPWGFPVQSYSEAPCQLKQRSH